MKAFIPLSCSHSFSLALSLSCSLSLSLSLTLSLSLPSLPSPSRSPSLLHCLILSPSFLSSIHKGKGVKTVWNQLDVSFWSRWNVGSTSIPYTILTSHILIKRNWSHNPVMQVESIPSELERAVKDFQRRVGSAQQTSQSESAPEEFSVAKGDIVIDYCFGLTALVHNQRYLGFFKKCSAINW